MATDPVCGMFVDERSAALKLVRDNRTVFFCSSSCLEEFARPEARLRALRKRLAVAWPLAVAVLVLTYLVTPGWAPYAAFALAAVVQAYPGGPFYRGTADALRSRVANMDVLIAVGTTVAFGYSAFALLLPGRVPPVYYFDASALIVTLILTGNYLEHLTRRRAGSAVRRLQELLPARAHVLRDGREVDVAVTDLKPGDHLRVLPGERFPADGVVRAGSSEADESLVTGESLPVPKSPGGSVVGGSLNGAGALEVEATRVGSDSFLAEVGRLLSDAETSQVPLQRLADRIAERFVPTVLVLAIVAALGWSLLGSGLTVAILVFVSVAITACPCAFGIATPAAIVVGTGRAAEAGVLFRGSDALERAGRVDLVLSDKTGTLTLGHPELTDLLPAPGVDELRLLEVAAGLELGSEHPLGRAVTRACAERGLAPAAVAEVRADVGEGVHGQLGGVAVSVHRLQGSEALPDALVGPLQALGARGRTASVVEEGGRVLGALGFSDPMAPGVPEAVRALGRLGVNVELVSGDSEAVAREVARQAGIREVHARMSPSAKLELLRRRQAEGHVVAFVGDGVNDAPVLAAADLGIAIGTGTDVAREAGRVLLVRPDFSGVPTVLALSRRTVRKVRQNLLWAIGYNAVLLPLAAGALVPWLGFGVFTVLPVTGALAMGLSSTTVVLNSFSLRWSSLGLESPRAPGASPASAVG